MNQEYIESQVISLTRKIHPQDLGEKTSKLENTLRQALEEAVAEERARMRENLPKIITPTVEPPPNGLSQNQIFASGQMNMLLRVFDLLESLDKPLTDDKCCGRLPNGEGWGHSGACNLTDKE